VKTTVQVDSREFQDAIRRYVKETGATLPVVLRKQSRLLFGRIIQRTYPRTRAEGRRAVARDIQRAVEPMKASSWDSKRIRKLIRERDYAGLQAAMEEMKPVYRAKVVQFDPRLHHESRDSRGRVRPTGFVSPDADEIRAYIRRTQENVGRAKGGFAAAMVASGGSPPDWVRRWQKAGLVVDRLRDPAAPLIESENRSEWAEHGDDDRIVAEAIRGRTQDMLVDLRKTLERAAKAASKHKP
jgi:hypothetical protein